MKIPKLKVEYTPNEDDKLMKDFCETNQYQNEQGEEVTTMADVEDEDD